jgi:hypothetical protein
MTLAVCGDAVVGRILALLLGNSGYKARYLPPSSLNDPRALEEVWLLLLTSTPQLSIERREELLATVKDIQEATQLTGLIVLELVTSSERKREEAQDGSWHMVPWPCRVEELEQRIEAALLAKSAVA